MENKQDNYNPIDYRINKDLNSMKPKPKSNIHKIFYSFFGIIILFSLIIILIQNNNNDNLKMDMKNFIVTDSIQKHTIDSLKHSADSLKRKTDSLIIVTKKPNR